MKLGRCIPAIFAVLCSSSLFLSCFAAPPVFQGTINPEESSVKIFRTNEAFVNSLETRYDTPIQDLFDNPELAHYGELDVASITGEPEKYSKAIVLVPMPGEEAEPHPTFLVTAVAVPPNVLERLNASGGTFLQVILPNPEHPHVSSPSNAHEGPESASSNGTSPDGNQGIAENGDGYAAPRPGVNQQPVGGAHTVYPEQPLRTPEEALELFLHRYIRVDVKEENEFIPETLRKALSSVQQVFVNPTAYLQVPEGQTGTNDQIYAITSAEPVEMVFGLFERLQ